MDTTPTPPQVEIAHEAVLIAGLAGMVAAEIGDITASTPLKRIGVLLADGTESLLGRCIYRNRHTSLVGAGILHTDLPRLPGTSIFAGVVGPQFGHMVTQSLGRLWMAELDPEARLVFLSANLGFVALPGYFVDLLRSLRIRNPVELINAPVICDRLLLGPDQCNLQLRPCMTPFFHDWCAGRRPTVPSGEPLDLYVSRSGLSLDHGQYLQETLLEAALEANGFTIFRPEKVPIPVQIDTYLRARRLIFADGSAAHLWSRFARPQAQSAILLRRPLGRHFAAWFRSTDCPQPEYLDFGMADIFRRGEGGGRSVGLLDMQGLWRALRLKGFHADQQDIGPPRGAVAAWLSGLIAHKGRLPVPPFPLDPRSDALMALRTRINVRDHSPQVPQGHAVL